MYAIRSYYAVGQHRAEGNSPYNPDDGFGKISRSFLKYVCHCFSLPFPFYNTMGDETIAEILVITSYSIHYTKLYDIHGTAFQSPVSERSACFLNGKDFCMRQSRFVFISFIISSSNDFSFMHNNTTNGNDGQHNQPRPSNSVISRRYTSPSYNFV